MDQKKVNFNIDQLKRYGFFQGVQHVAINTFEVFLDIVKFWPFLLYFIGIFGAKNFQVFQDRLELILHDRTGI